MPCHQTFKIKFENEKRVHKFLFIDYKPYMKLLIKKIITTKRLLISGY